MVSHLVICLYDSYTICLHIWSCHCHFYKQNCINTLTVCNHTFLYKCKFVSKAISYSTQIFHNTCCLKCYGHSVENEKLYSKVLQFYGFVLKSMLYWCQTCGAFQIWKRIFFRTGLELAWGIEWISQFLCQFLLEIVETILIIPHTKAMVGDSDGRVARCEVAGFSTQQSILGARARCEVAGLSTTRDVLMAQARCEVAGLSTTQDCHEASMVVTWEAWLSEVATRSCLIGRLH